MTLRLHWFPLSGHSHRAELMLSLLGLPFEKILVDVRTGAHKQPSFLSRNALGQLPVLEDGALTLPDSNAILVYLAQRYDASRRWLPIDPAVAGEVQRWLSIAAGELRWGPAALRLAAIFGMPIDKERATELTDKVLRLASDALAGRAFLVGDSPTIADVAMYTYLAHAPEGGVSLEPYASVRAWLARIEALPGFVGMQRAPAKG